MNPVLQTFPPCCYCCGRASLCLCRSTSSWNPAELWFGPVNYFSPHLFISVCVPFSYWCQGPLHVRGAQSGVWRVAEGFITPVCLQHNLAHKLHSLNRIIVKFNPNSFPLSSSVFITVDSHMRTHSQVIAYKMARAHKMKKRVYF